MTLDACSHGVKQLEVPTKLCLVAVLAQSFAQSYRFGFGQNGCAAEVSLPLVAHAVGQVARTTLTVLDLALPGDAEALFGTLVGLHLRHDANPQ